MTTEPGTVQAVLPIGQSLQVVCAECGMALGGLFVVTAAARAGAAAARVQTAVAAEGGDAPAPISASEIKVTHTLGMTNRDGYVEPVLSGNPWYYYFGGLRAGGEEQTSHTVPFFTDQPIWLIRHPNAELARAFADWLDTGEDPKKFGFAAWGDPAKLAVGITPVVSDRVPFAPAGGAAIQGQFALKVPEEPQRFLPLGPELYDHWSLYRDMPNASCKPVSKQVARLQYHLGTLRYPIGRQEYPYWPEPRQKQDDLHRNLGIFEGRTQAALGAFQEHAHNKRAAKVRDLARTHGKHLEMASSKDGQELKPSQRFAPKSGAGGAWLYQIVDDVTPSGAAELGEYTLGCVDVVTGRALAAWLEQGLRKPGPILLEVDLGRGGIWLREEAAVAVEAWMVLAKAFGIVYRPALSSGHSFRNILDKGAGGGKRLNSIHKTGLAIDMSSFGYTVMLPEWPVRLEAQWLKENDALTKARAALCALEAKERQAKRAYDAAPSTAAEVPRGKRAKLKVELAPAWEGARQRAEAQRKVVDRLTAADAADETQTKSTFRLRFRIYGHSALDLYSHASTSLNALEKLRQQLAQCAQEFWQVLAHKLELPGGEGWQAAAEKWMASPIELVRNVSNKLGQLDDAELVDRFFRDSVKVWLYNDQELDGGSEGPLLKVDQSTPNYPKPSAGAKSFVNLTALGGELQMARINATRNGCWKDPSGMKGKLSLVTREVRKGLDPIIESLDAMRAPASAHREDLIPITHARETTELAQAQVDLEAMRTWSRLLGDLKTADGRQGVVKTDVPQVTLLLAISRAKKEALERVLGLLDNQVGGRGVLLLSPGEATGLTGLQKTIVKVSQVVAALHKALEAIEAQAVKEKADSDAWLKEVKDAKRKGRKPSIPEPRRSKPRSTAELSVTLQPVFVFDAKAPGLLFYPDDVVEVPERGNPQGLEWWHFQHQIALNKPWGTLLSDIGFSTTILQVPENPPLDSVFWGRGTGYHEADVSDPSGGVPVRPEQLLENYNTYTPKGG